jgi:EAL domain-containing protein (putative c-di-GMP-specific phosphodiesterase class I)
LWCNGRSALELQLKVVAEGAETEAQAAYQGERRCGGAQATTLARVYPPTSFAQMLKKVK